MKSIDEIRWEWATIDAYVPVPDNEDWKECPKCLKRPRVWIFDNGRYAKCQCGEKYDGARVSAEAIGQYVSRNNGSIVGYNDDELRLNWNTHILNQ